MMPQLIQDTIDFYRKWIAVKEMNRDYFENVRLVTNEYGKYLDLFGYYDVIWRRTNIHIIRGHIFVSIRSFTKGICFPINHPQKYQYSSGMNHPTAYKKY